MKYPPELVEAFNSNPQGSIDDAYDELCGHQKEEDIEGNPISWKEILKIYVKYIKFCDAQGIEGRYRKYLSNWIRDKGFLSSYDIQDSKRSRLVSKWLKGILKLFMSW